MRRESIGIGWAALALVALLSVNVQAKPAGEWDRTLLDRIEPAKTLDLRTQGYRLLELGDRAGALDALRVVSEQNPADVKLRVLVGDLHAQQDELPQALKAWTDALAERPYSERVLMRVVGGAAHRGDYVLAANAQARRVERAKRRYEHRPNLRRARELGQHLAIHSELAVLAGDYTSAEESARDLIRLDPKGTRGRLAMAYVHLQAAEYLEAEDLYIEVLTLQSDNAIALNNLGNIHYMRRDLQTAADHFEAILALPDVSGYSASIAWSNLGEIYQLEGQYDDAEYLYRQGIEAQPDGAWSYMGLAALYDLKGEHDKAVDSMIDGWERDQNYLTRLNMHFYQPEWYWHRDALIAEIEGEVDVARSLWRRVRKGQVDALHAVAQWHLDALEADLH